MFRVPRSMMPEVRRRAKFMARCSDALGLGAIPDRGNRRRSAGGAVRAALHCPGLTKNTYGTGCFLLQNIGTQAGGFVEPAGYDCGLEDRRDDGIRTGRQRVYRRRGGAVAARWLGPDSDFGRGGSAGGSVPDNGGVYFVPAFVGLGAPHWDSYARGTMIGLTRDTTAGHIARAALESIAFQVADLLDAMQRDTGTPLQELRVDGGAAANDVMMQFQADILGVPVVRPAVTETTALGAAYLAGLQSGFWRDVSAIAAMPRSKSASSRGCHAAQRKP